MVKLSKEASAGFEPAPRRTSALNWRLRPLGHETMYTEIWFGKCNNPHFTGESYQSTRARLQEWSSRNYESKCHHRIRQFRQEANACWI